MFGKVKFYNNTGWGFIIPTDGGKDIFFHRSKVTPSCVQYLDAEVEVQFDTFTNSDGKLQACSVRTIPSKVNGNGNGEAKVVVPKNRLHYEPVPSDVPKPEVKVKHETRQERRERERQEVLSVIQGVIDQERPDCPTGRVLVADYDGVHVTNLAEFRTQSKRLAVCCFSHMVNDEARFISPSKTGGLIVVICNRCGLLIQDVFPSRLISDLEDMRPKDLKQFFPRKVAVS
ncbi:MAG: cold shock domain-containing protein [Pseudomonadota bacterium]